MNSDVIDGSSETGGPEEKGANVSRPQSFDEAPQPDSEQTRVLVASSDATTLQLYENTLDSKRFKVLSSRTRLDTLGETIRFRPEIIILDSCLQKSTGLEVASEVLSMRPNSKVIFVMRNSSISKHAEKLGIDVFLKWADSFRLILGCVYALSSLKYTCVFVPR